MLVGKKILLGITGGIAAYKCTFLVRLLIKQGAEVKVILTKSALNFVTPQSLSVLSKNEVLIDFYDNNNNWNNHVQLADWADLLLIAPLTANTLAKMANGQCDNLLLATYFSSKCKIILSPAMDLEMFQHPTVKANLKSLANFGNIILAPEFGELASGLVGEGRLPEPETIIKEVQDLFNTKLPFKGKTVLINAGPTYEAIDPIRFIGNRSSGKMGIAIAETFAKQGANVTLVLGPTHLKPNDQLLKVVYVENGEKMYVEMFKRFKNNDIVICSAAVSDYKPENVHSEKIKKKSPTLDIKLLKTKDILFELGKKKVSQFLVGFALETNNLIKNAKEKLVQKNCDLMVANSTGLNNQAFNSDDNKVLFIESNNKITKFGLMSKQQIAEELAYFIYKKISKN